jgi:5-methylcytosine-specific restriction enzyme subunit McrC
MSGPGNSTTPPAADGPAQRTLLVRERRPAECRLSVADVAFLQTCHATHIQVAPVARRGRYRVTPAGHVGTIVGPDCRLVIRPKVALANLFHLLDPAAPLPVADDGVTAAAGTEPFQFLAGRLARHLAERSAAGLHHAYAERSHHGPHLRGRLDLPAQLRDAGGRKDRLHCRYEEFTVDVACNQLSKATADLVLRSPLLAPAVGALLRRALAPFAEVASVPIGPDSFDAVTLDRLTEPYRPLLALCRLLVEGLSADCAAGPVPYPAFLLDMERVFERYCTAAVVQHLAGDAVLTAAVQQWRRAAAPVDGQPDLSLRPDLVVQRRGRPVLVLDAKWKRPPATALVTEDVYQVLAYCTALGVRRAVLVYPGRRDRVWTYRLEQGSIRLAVRTLRVTGSGAECERSVRRLLRGLGGMMR